MIVRWENSEGWVEFRDTYRLRLVEGLGLEGITLYTDKAPYQDGEFLVGHTFKARKISLDVIIIGNNEEQDERRRRLVRLFNPKAGMGTLTIKVKNNTYIIDGIVEELRFPGALGSGTSPSHQLAQISIVAPNPFFRGETLYTIVLAGVFGGWDFPFKFPLLFGTIGKFKKVQNDGDVPAPIFIVAYGPLENFYIKNNTTGYKIQLNMAIASGERVEIETSWGKKSVVLVRANGTRVNAFPYLTVDSVLFSLIPGENELEYGAEVEGEGSLFVVSYQNWYAGV